MLSIDLHGVRAQGLDTAAPVATVFRWGKTHPDGCGESLGCGPDRSSSRPCSAPLAAAGTGRVCDRKRARCNETASVIDLVFAKLSFDSSKKEMIAAIDPHLTEAAASVPVGIRRLAPYHLHALGAL